MIVLDRDVHRCSDGRAIAPVCSQKHGPLLLETIEARACVVVSVAIDLLLV
jgi:hypothetical protein